MIASQFFADLQRQVTADNTLAYTVGTPTADAACPSFVPSPEPHTKTLRHVEHVIGPDGDLRRTGRIVVVTYRLAVEACHVENGEA